MLPFGAVRPDTAVAAVIATITVVDPLAGVRTLSSARPKPTVEPVAPVVKVLVIVEVVPFTTPPAIVAVTVSPETRLPNTSVTVAIYVATVPAEADDGPVSVTLFAAPVVPFTYTVLVTPRLLIVTEPAVVDVLNA